MSDLLVVAATVAMVAFFVLWAMVQLLFPRTVIRITHEVLLPAMFWPFDRFSDWVDKQAGVQRPITAVQSSRRFRGPPSAREVLLTRILGLVPLLMVAVFLAALFGVFR